MSRPDGRMRSPPTYLRGWLSLLIALPLFATAHPARSVLVHVVNSTADRPHGVASLNQCDTGILISLPSGLVSECTLRAAIQSTNAIAGPDFILFNPDIFVDGQGFVSINPESALPAISSPVTINGKTAPGYNQSNPDQPPIVQINGSAAGAASGIQILPSAVGTTILGLALHEFLGFGIFSGADDVLIQGCHVGIRNSSLATGNGSDGIWIDGDNGTIGQTFSSSSGWSGTRNVISANGGAGLLVSGSNNLIAGNYVGTDVTGQFAIDGFGVPTGNAKDGIDVSGDSNTIGGEGVLQSGTKAASGNVISGNLQHGVEDTGSSNSFFGNLIGTDRTGMSAVGNVLGFLLRGGLTVVGSSGPSRNVISGNDADGFLIFATAAVGIEGNLIGLDADGSGVLPNGGDGIDIQDGDATILDNSIGGNDGNGIYGDTTSSSIIITGNYVGTNASGTNLGNGGMGIRVLGSNNTIGGPGGAGNVVGFNQGGIEHVVCLGCQTIGNFVGTDSAGLDLGNATFGLRFQSGDGSTIDSNTIGFNETGIEVHGDSARFTRNYIGTNTNGDDLGNTGVGLEISGIITVVGSERGETTASAIVSNGNEIAFNGSGIEVIDTARFVTIRGNRIHSNTGLGIDLSADGRTSNDADDADVGENSLQNFPLSVEDAMITGPGPGVLQVRYLVDSHPAHSNYPLRIDFYVADAAAQEGMAWVGSDAYSGPMAQTFKDATIAVDAGAGLLSGDFIVATATSDIGIGETSEFSDPIRVLPEPDPGASLLFGWAGLTLVSRVRSRERAAKVCGGLLGALRKRRLRRSTRLRI